MILILCHCCYFKNLASIFFFNEDQANIAFIYGNDSIYSSQWDLAFVYCVLIIADVHWNDHKSMERRNIQKINWTKKITSKTKKRKSEPKKKKRIQWNKWESKLNIWCDEMNFLANQRKIKTTALFYLIIKSYIHHMCSPKIFLNWKKTRNVINIFMCDTCWAFEFYFRLGNHSVHIKRLKMTIKLHSTAICSRTAISNRRSEAVICNNLIDPMTSCWCHIVLNFKYESQHCTQKFTNWVKISNVKMCI